MIDTLAQVLIGVSLAVGAWCLVTGLLNRSVGTSHLVALAVLEVTLLAKMGMAIAMLLAGERPADMATFIGYLIGSPLVLPVAAFIALAERTRWGSVVAGVGCLVVPVLILRLHQIWQGTGA